MAGKNNTAERVRAIVERPIESFGIDLVDVEYVKEGADWYLRLYIDKPGGVSLDDCQLVHEGVTDLIDEADPIAGPYIFEVSSPGLDRPLKTERDFVRNIGQEVELSLYAPDERGKKAYTGILTACEADVVTVQTETDGLVGFPIKNLSLVKKTIQF